MLFTINILYVLNYTINLNIHYSFRCNSSCLYHIFFPGGGGGGELDRFQLFLLLLEIPGGKLSEKWRKIGGGGHNGENKINIE